MTGKEFEQILKDSCEQQGCLFVRFRDAGYTGVNNSETSQRFTIKNIADCFVYNDNIMAVIELKHRKQSLAFKDITQFKALDKLHNQILDYGLQKATCGVLVCFNGDMDKMYWVSIPALIELQQFTGKKSFNYKDCDALLDELPMLLVKVDSIKLPRKRKLRINTDFLNKII